MNQRGADLEKALARFKKVVRTDLEYAAAWSGLAATYVVYPDYLPMNRRQSLIDAREAAEKSLELKPGQAEPIAVLGLVAAQDYRWSDAMEYFDLAIALNPGEPSAFLWKGIQLLEVGYPDKAERALRKAVDLAPGTGVNNSWLAAALLLNGEIEEAERYANRGLDLDHMFASAVLSEIYEMRGDLVSAAAIIDDWHRFSGIEPFRSASLAYAARGDAQLESEITEWALHASGTAGGRAPVRSLLIIKSPRALELMQTLVSDAPAMIANLWFPRYAYLRALPDFEILLEEIKLPDYWNENGWPRWCKPSVDGPVCE